MALTTSSTWFFGNISNGSATIVPNQSMPDANDVPDALLYPLMISCVVAVLENLTVCILIATNRNLRTATNTFVFSLCAADICFAALILPIHCFYRTSIIYGYIVLIAIITYVLNLTAVTYERLVSLTNPLRYHAIITKRFALKTILVAWAIPLPYCLIPSIWEGNKRKLAHKVYMSCTLVIFLLIPLIFILFVYGRIFIEIRKLYEHRKQLVIRPKKAKKNRRNNDLENNMLTEPSTLLQERANFSSKPKRGPGKYLQLWKNRRHYKSLKLMDISQPSDGYDKQDSCLGNGSIDVQVHRSSSQSRNGQLPKEQVSDKNVGCSLGSDLNKNCGTCCCTSQTLLEILNAGKRGVGESWSDLSMINGQFKRNFYGSDQNLSTLFVKKSPGDHQSGSLSASCASFPEIDYTASMFTPEAYESLQDDGKYSNELLFSSRPCCYLANSSKRGEDSEDESSDEFNTQTTENAVVYEIKRNSTTSLKCGHYIDDCNSNRVFIAKELTDVPNKEQKDSPTPTKGIDLLPRTLRKWASENNVIYAVSEPKRKDGNHRLSFPMDHLPAHVSSHDSSDKRDFFPVDLSTNTSHGNFSSSNGAQRHSSTIELMVSGRSSSDRTDISRNFTGTEQYKSPSWPYSLRNISTGQDQMPGSYNQSNSSEETAVQIEEIPVSNQGYTPKRNMRLKFSCLGQHFRRRGKRLSRASILSDEKRRKSHVDKFKTVVAELKSSLAFAAVAFTYMFTWLPVGYMTFMEVIEREYLVPAVLSEVSVFTIALNAVIDPLLYALLLRDFKKYSKRCFRRLCGFRKRYNEW